MRKILFATLLLTCFLHVMAADETIDGIFAWVSGSSTCYKLSEMPKVSYSGEYAILTLGESSTPQLSVKLEEGATLEITYGTYKPSDIHDVTDSHSSKVEKIGKFIRGGKLIIVKDGKQYDANGVEIR